MITVEGLLRAMRDTMAKERANLETVMTTPWTGVDTVRTQTARVQSFHDALSSTLYKAGADVGLVNTVLEASPAGGDA